MSQPDSKSSNQPTNSPADSGACEALRSTIRRLQAELADRESCARPLPSSVMRAYQKLIDRHYQALEAATTKRDE